jgi:hypothetical protein
MAGINTIQINLYNMNVIIIRRNGLISDSPILVKNDYTAEVVYESLVEDLLGDDDCKYFGDDSITKNNHLLESMGIQIDWFVDIEVNKYINK